MLPDRKMLPHAVPDWVEDGAVYLITVNCKRRNDNQLCVEPVARRLKSSFELQHSRRLWWIRLLVLMPDHWHGLISFSCEISMEKSMSDWKRFNARDLNIEWQRDFFDHRIRDMNSLQEKEMYLRMNPVRRGLCQIPEEWKYTWAASDFER